MPHVTHLLTSVDIDDRSGGTSIRAWHHAVLEDGRRLVLLEDRGWSGGTPSTWGLPGYGDIEQTARSVVGPDGANGEESQAEVDTAHWELLAARLGSMGLAIRGAELRVLPHDVELSERLQAQVARNRSTLEA